MRGRWGSVTILQEILHYEGPFLQGLPWPRVYEPDCCCTTLTFPQTLRGKMHEFMIVTAYGFITFFTWFCILLRPSVCLETHFPDYDRPICEPSWVMLSFFLIDMPHPSAHRIMYLHFSDEKSTENEFKYIQFRLILEGLLLCWVLLIWRKLTRFSLVVSYKEGKTIGSLCILLGNIK